MQVDWRLALLLHPHHGGALTQLMLAMLAALPRRPCLALLLRVLAPARVLMLTLVTQVQVQVWVRPQALQPQLWEFLLLHLPAPPWLAAAPFWDLAQLLAQQQEPVLRHPALTAPYWEGVATCRQQAGISLLCICPRAVQSRTLQGQGQSRDRGHSGQITPPSMQPSVHTVHSPAPRQPQACQELQCSVPSTEEEACIEVPHYCLLGLVPVLDLEGYAGDRACDVLYALQGHCWGADVSDGGSRCSCWRETHGQLVMAVPAR